MRALLILLAAALLIAACGGGDDDSGDGTPAPVTAVGTKGPTPAGGESTGSTTDEAPPPVEPELDEELTEIARDSLDLTLEPGAAHVMDPQELADPGSFSCDSFQFDFSWQISDPYPSGSATVDWFITRNGEEIKVASGPSGNQAVGCDTLRVVNGGSETVSLAVRYALGTTPP